MDRYIGLKLDGRYEITEIIGVGGMANVYRGRDIMENRTVAVKILKSEYSENEEFVRRFRNESKAIAVLSHPNIVKIYDVGYENSMQYIVMEYIDGITLKEYIEQQGILKWRDCVHFTIQILRALQLAHDRGIVHRDIKPQNVMLLSDGSIKVMDFGIARFSREVEKNANEKTMGSVHYVSPEQAAGARTDERSDIYSVGVMMYEMLTGVKPFDGETPVAVALKHMHEQPVAPTVHAPNLYPGLEEIILHAMEKDPTKRYQSASGMIRDIEAFKQDQSIVFGYTDGRSERRTEQGKDGAGSAAKAKLTAAISAIKTSKKPKKEKRAKAEYEPEEEIIEQDYYDYYDDDDDEVIVRHNYALPILAAITCTVIIVATLFVANVILGAFKTTASSINDYEMPNLIGENFYDARAKYPDIQLVASEEYNSQYEAGTIIEQEKAEGRFVKIGDAIKVTVSKGTRIVKIPDVKNYYASSAIKALEDYGLRYVLVQTASEDIASGLVVRTDPAADSEVEEGTEVKILVSLGPMTEDTTVPYVVGNDVITAKNALSDAHLVPKLQYSASSEPRDQVISQNIEGGSRVPRDSVITIYISDGSGEEELPEENIPDINDPWFDDPNIPDSTFTPPDHNEPQPSVQKSITIFLDIPSDVSSSFDLEFCYSGTEDPYSSDSFRIDAITWAGYPYPINLYGSGTVSLDAYIKSGGMKLHAATYVVNFDEGTYTIENYQSSSFRTLETFMRW